MRHPCLTRIAHETRPRRNSHSANGPATKDLYVRAKTNPAATTTTPNAIQSELVALIPLIPSLQRPPVDK